MTGVVILLALMAIFSGPTVRRARTGVRPARTGVRPAATPLELRERARDVLSRYLDGRRSGAEREPEAEAPEPASEPAPGPRTVDVDRGRIFTIGGPVPLSIWLRHQTCGLRERWERDVLDADPRRLPRELSRVAGRGGAMFRDLAPDLSSEFDALRERFDAHSRNGPHMSDAEFRESFERMEALVSIAGRRAAELIHRLAEAW